MRYEPGGKKDRQYGTLEQIRPDHVRRYLWAASVIPVGARVLDLACGCGYGSWLLHGAGLDVTSIDISQEAIEYAQKHYQGPKYIRQSAEETTGEYDVLVSFETLEHIPDPVGFLRNIKAKFVVASVPNETLYPFKKENYVGESFPHLRHYTPTEFGEMLKEGGYTLEQLNCQRDKAGMVFPGSDGIFLLAVARGA